MTAFEDQHSVWTDHHDPAWVSRYGLPDMRITDGVSLDTARYTCDRLLMLLPDNRFYIKNIHNVVVGTYEIRPVIQTSDGPSRRRRPLGMPETYNHKA